MVNEWRVYWDQGTGVWAASDPPTVTYPTMTYTKTGLEAGVFYKFKVSAVNDIGESPQSAESDAIIAALVPLQPLLLSAESADQTSITISWAEPSDSRGSPIASYHVYMDGTKMTTDPGITELLWT